MVKKYLGSRVIFGQDEVFFVFVFFVVVFVPLFLQCKKLDCSLSESGKLQ